MGAGGSHAPTFASRGGAATTPPHTNNGGADETGVRLDSRRPYSMRLICERAASRQGAAGRAGGAQPSAAPSEANVPRAGGIAAGHHFSANKPEGGHYPPQRCWFSSHGFQMYPSLV